MDDMLDEKGIEVVGGLLSLSLSEVLLLKGVSLGEEARFAGDPRDDAEEANGLSFLNPPASPIIPSPVKSPCCCRYCCWCCIPLLALDGEAFAILNSSK